MSFSERFFSISKAFLIIVFSLAPVMLFSQETIILKGKITAPMLEEAGVHIINVSRKKVAINSASGDFNIEVGLNDTLQFTSIQYREETVIISEEIIHGRFLSIELLPAVNELPEVRLSSGLTGNMMRDVESMKIIDKYALGVPLNKSELPTQEERRLYTATYSANGNISPDFLINTITGRIKMLKEHKEISNLVSLVKTGKESLPEEFFVEELRLHNVEIINFMYFCAEFHDLKAYISKDNELALREYFREKIVDYRSFLNN